MVTDRMMRVCMAYERCSSGDLVSPRTTRSGAVADVCYTSAQPHRSILGLDALVVWEKRDHMVQVEGWKVESGGEIGAGVSSR